MNLNTEQRTREFIRGGGVRVIARFLPVIALAALTLFAGCRQGKTATSSVSAKDASGIHKTVERGPVKLTLDLDRKTLTIAQRLNLKLTVTSDEAYRTELPAYGEKLESFGIVDYHTSEPVLVGNGKQQITREYVLEPFLSGTYKIPPMTVRFWKKGEEDKPHKIQTEEATVEVTSLLPEDLKELKIQDIADPVDIPLDLLPFWIGGGVVLALLLCAAVAILLWRRRPKSVAPPPPIPAHLMALAELRKLGGENLIEKGEIKTFYQRLSDILRRYIENRFGLRAPEETTEEFLESLRYNETLNRSYRALLEAFLNECDLVKFAEYTPQTQDIQRAFDSCKSFIIGTQEPDETKQV